MPDALPVRPPCRLGVRVTFNGIVYDRPCRRPEHARPHPHPRVWLLRWGAALLRHHPAHAVTCRRAFPILIRGRTYYVACDQPHGHDAPCTGRATDWGAPTL